mmetsp:Transcript_50468/g.120062  ORF Transcript_50468/g.120062 Transcript_50468/m.120062 type:complete len:767 (-) Transcript_50468:68-2368(-)
MPISLANPSNLDIKHLLGGPGVVDSKDLLEPAKRGDVNAVLNLVARGAQVTVTDAAGNSPLLLAAARGHFRVVKLLLEHRADPCSEMRNAATAVYVAAEAGALDVVRLLIELGANPDSAKKGGATPLLIAVQMRTPPESRKAEPSVWLEPRRSETHLAMIKYLLDQKTDRSAQMHPMVGGLGALHVAAAAGDFEVVRELLSFDETARGVTSGVDMINAKSGDGSTPIFLAAQNDRPNVVDFLLSQKADPNSSQAGRQAWTPLHIASCHGFRDVLQLLVKHGAALEARLNEHSSDPPRLVPSLPAASKNKASDKHAPPTSHGNPSSKPSGEKWAALHGQAPGQLQRYSSGGATALYVAAERQHLESVELLVASRAKVDAALGNKCTPLFVACDRGNLPIAKVLMDNRANIHAVAENEFTPLLVAAGNNRKGCVQELIRRGADLNAMTTSSRTALFLAVESGHFEVAQLLIRAGAMCNLGLETGESPLFIAVEKGRIDLAKELLGAPHPADPNVVLDYRKYHPLYVATFDNRPDMMTLLIEHKARVDEKIERGFSPIYIAAQMNHPEALEVLLKAKTEQARAEAVSRGVDTTLVEKVVKFEVLDAVDCKNEDGYTPLLVASHKGYARIVQRVIAAGANTEHRNGEGRTALHLAAEQGHHEVVKILMAAGANTLAKDNNGDSALRLAGLHVLTAQGSGGAGGHGKVLSMLNAVVTAHLQKLTDPLSVAADTPEGASGFLAAVEEEGVPREDESVAGENPSATRVTASLL